MKMKFFQFRKYSFLAVKIDIWGILSLSWVQICKFYISHFIWWRTRDAKRGKIDASFGWNCLLCCINRITMGKRIEKTGCHLRIWAQLRLRIPKMSIFTAKDEYFVKCKNIHLHFLHDKFDIFERNMSRNIPYAPWKTIQKKFRQSDKYFGNYEQI